MSVVRKLLGTIEDRFWLFQDATSNLLGVYGVNPDGAHIEFRDAADALIQVKGADGVDPQDFATMNQIGGGGGGSAGEWIMIPVAFTDQGGSVASTMVIPDGAIILDVRVNVTTPFAIAATPTAMPLTAELTGVGTDFLDAADSDTMTGADYIKSTVHMNSSGGALSVTVSCGAAAGLDAGAANVFVSYATPAT